MKPADGQRILLLGGIGEARALAAELTDLNISVVYSVAGLVRTPSLNCEVRSGGFSSTSQSGIDGLAAYIRQNNITLLLNATHPYATTMAHHATTAARRCGVPCWRYYRPGWSEAVKGEYLAFDNLPQLFPLLAAVKKPFFTIGKGVLEYLDCRPADQHWIVRTALKHPIVPGLTCLHAIGPFSLADDLKLMQAHEIDALITKDSGGDNASGKLRAAQQLGIPVFIQRRPDTAAATRQFTDISALRDAVVALTGC